MAKFVDLDDRGVATYEDMTVDNKLQIHYQQDVEPILELSKYERVNGLTDKGIKNDMWLYARIPPVVILEMRFKHGVNIFDRNHQARAVDLINREYPYLKTTEKHHGIKH